MPFKKAIEIKNDYFEALNNLGTLYQILGKNLLVEIVRGKT